MNRYDRRVRLVLVVSLVMGVLVTPALSCNDPSLHPEFGEFQVLVDSLGEQPVVPLQVLYRVSPEALGSSRRAVSLLFQATRGTPHDEATFSLTPSEGIELTTEIRDVEVNERPARLSLETKGSGLHYLRLDLAVRMEGEQRLKTILIPVMAGLNDMHTPGMASAVPGIMAKPAVEGIRMEQH
jgi:hypothetical protein